MRSSSRDCIDLASRHNKVYKLPFYSTSSFGHPCFFDLIAYMTSLICFRHWLASRTKFHWSTFSDIAPPFILERGGAADPWPETHRLYDSYYNTFQAPVHLIHRTSIQPLPSTSVNKHRISNIFRSTPPILKPGRWR